MTTYYNKTERIKVRRRAGRGDYKRSTIHSILDEGMVGHVGVVGDDAQPFVILGQGRAIQDPERKDQALRALVEHIVPGRSDDARGPSRKELKATEVIELEIDEASAKIRTGPPGDASADMELPVWAGVVPITTSFGEPVADVACSMPAP